ncbi:proline--tRNA ligase [Helicobacter sp. 23-1048]
MKFSQLFIPTLKESPKDAVLKSHQYLVRAGYIQQVGAGIYNFLPLGKKMLDTIRTIIKEEMDNAGAQELLFGFVTPAEMWEESGRFGKYGKELLRFSDRKENAFVLGPTYEEVATHIARSFVKSYKQLPLNIYQIHTKFRDEARPRFGLMRAREFVMKDAYSFHSTKEDLDREFDTMERAYRRILDRLGLEYKVVEADSGVIGGSGSKEFMVLAPCGEDTLAICKSCGYAANLEAAKRALRTSIDSTQSQSSYPIEPPKADFSKFLTPSTTTIQSLCEFFKVNPFYTIKAVAKKAIYEEIKSNKESSAQKSEWVVFFTRGDDECEETKALNALNTMQDCKNYLFFEECEIDEKSGIVAGFIGGIGLQCPHIFDISLKGASNLIMGANERDYHFVGVDMNSAELAHKHYADITKVREGDLCECCGKPLSHTKGIEIGHIFKLGDTYSKSMNATFLDSNGKAQHFIMGCYGIGVTRLLPAILEQKADEFGCVWGSGAKIFDVVIIVSNTKDCVQMDYALQLYENLRTKNVDVVLDDRDERFGFKMSDFELIGFDRAIVVGKLLSDNKVEIITREGRIKREIDKDLVLAEFSAQ